MRPLGRYAATLALLVTLSACSSTDGGEGDAAASPSPSRKAPSADPGTPESPGSPDPSDPPTELPSDPPEAFAPNEDSEACAEVVAGIADFNSGDFEGTVGHFEDAVPLAEAEVEASPPQDADQSDLLLEAVRYYADLAPDDYPAASAGSPDFQRYKAITLGQCVSAGQAPGVPAPDEGTPV